MTHDEQTKLVKYGSIAIWIACGLKLLHALFFGHIGNYRGDSHTVTGLIMAAGVMIAISFAWIEEYNREH